MSFPVEGDGSLNGIFQRIPLSTFWMASGEKVFMLPASTSVAKAAQELGKRNFLCAPVVSDTAAPDAAWSEKYAGIVDFLAIVDWMVRECQGEPPKSLDELCALKEAFTKTPVADLAKNARWSQFIPLDFERDTALDVMLLLGKYGVHRVCTINTPAGDLHSIITQSAVVTLLHNNLDMLRGIGQKTVDQLGLGKSHRDVISVKNTDTYWDAFRKMSANLVSAVPVVDENGAFVGNVSVKDLRSKLRTDATFMSLNQQIGKSGDFFGLHYSCQPETNIEALINKIHHTGIHRVYLVDKENKPVAVISLREIIACMVKEPPESKLYEYFAY